MLSRLNLKDRALEKSQARSGYSPARQRLISGQILSLSETMSYFMQFAWAQCRDPEQTNKLYEKYKPTHVIHLAALGMFSATDPRICCDIMPL
jgi:hypothetical protein